MKDSDFKPLHADEKGTVVPPIPGDTLQDSQGVPETTDSKIPCWRKRQHTLAHSTILAWRIPVDRGAWWATAHRVAKSQIRRKQLSTHRRNRFTQVTAITPGS